MYLFVYEQNLKKKKNINLFRRIFVLEVTMAISMENKQKNIKKTLSDVFSAKLRTL